MGETSFGSRFTTRNHEASQSTVHQPKSEGRGETRCVPQQQGEQKIRHQRRTLALQA